MQVEKMYKYEHGGDIYSDNTKKYIDFSANINPLGLPQGIKQAVTKALKNCINYPDPFCHELSIATGNFLQVPHNYLLFGNGAADVLFRLILALKPRHALILAPTFSDYEKALRSVNCNIHYYNLCESNKFVPAKDILTKITTRTDLVIICNPNNPTGQIVPQPLLEAILKKCHQVNARLLIDECFMDFVSEKKAFSMRNLLNSYPELIILKAFTKTFAMPGIRLGYCMCSDDNLHYLFHQYGQDWNVSILAQEAGKAAVEQKQYLHESMLLVEEERIYLKNQLKALGAKVYGSEANYIFFYMPHPENLSELLRKQGYLIRSCANYNNLKQGYYRIAVKTRVQNRGLIKAFKEAKKYALFTSIN